MFLIQQLTNSDFTEIRRIFLQTFPRTDDADFANAWRTKECNYSLGLYHKATLVGFAITCLEEFGDGSLRPTDNVNCAAARLWFIAVDKVHRSAGAGTLLLNAVIDAVSSHGLRLALTPDNSERVILWYKRHGFVITQHFPFVHNDIPTCRMEWRPNLIIEEAEPSSPVSTETLSSQSSTCSNSRCSFGSMDALEI
jgi:ribosomal protein S18 acetylase RimI-like enzyme